MQSESEVKVTQSCPTLCNPMDYTFHGILQTRILEWVAFPFSIGSSHLPNPGLLHCGWILYQLSHKGSPRILEWVAYSFSRGSSQHRTRTGVSCIAGGFFTNWAMREALSMQRRSDIIRQRSFTLCAKAYFGKILGWEWCGRRDCHLLEGTCAPKKERMLCAEVWR